MITSILEYKKILEKKEEVKLKKRKATLTDIKDNKGTDLIICDIQDVYQKYFPDNYLEQVKEYSEAFARVYQIWDNTKADKHSYNFPNQCGLYMKKYGGKLTLDNIKLYFHEHELENIAEQLKVIPDVGTRFDTIYGDSWIYIGQYAESNNVKGHNWFLCPKELVDLFLLLKKQNRKVILIGGATGECITDIFITMKSFDIDVKYNMNFLYSA